MKHDEFIRRVNELVGANEGLARDIADIFISDEKTMSDQTKLLTGAYEIICLIDAEAKDER